MEEGLERDPRVELKDEEFHDFALATHKPAYKTAGIAGVPITDDLKVLGTLTWESWKDPATRGQMLDIGVGIVIDKAKQKAIQISNELRGADMKRLEALGELAEELLD